MRENAHDYFLSAKARFQVSDDLEDAAELYFAARNMANHGHEVEWDDVLMKAMGKFKDKVTGEEIEFDIDQILDFEEAIYESRFSTGRPATLASETGRRTGRARTDLDRKAPMTSMGKHRSHIVGDDRRRVFAEPICSDFPGGAYYDKVLKREEIPEAFRTPGGPTTTRPYEEMLRSFRDPLAHRDGSDAISEIRASRPRSSEQSGSRDEMAMQGWFIETSRYPKVYDHLLDYYHPDSPFFVGSETHGDRRIDAHSQSIVEKYLPSRSSLAPDRAGIKTRFDTGQPIFDLEDPEDRERLNHMRDQVGIYGPDAMGQWDLEQRTRLYTSRYNQWLKEYQRRFPESSVDEDDLKKVFIDHLMLDIDGVGYSDPVTGNWDDEIVWAHLYNPDGQPMHQLPRPGIQNIRSGYLSMAHMPDYANVRDRRRAMGLEALRAGLICVGPDNADRLLHASQQARFLKSLQTSPVEVQKFILGPSFKEDMEFLTAEGYADYLHHLVDDDGNERMFDPAYQTFHDGTPAPPILMGAMARYMDGHRLVMNTAMAKFMTNSTDTPHEADQPVLYPKEANLVKECLSNMLKNAHMMKYERDRRERQKETDLDREQILPDRKPLHRKLYQASTQSKDDGDWDWDPVHDIPKMNDNNLETFHDLHVFLNMLRERQFITNTDYVKMLLYADSEMDGSQAYSFNRGRQQRDFSNKRRHQHLRAAAPLLDSVWGIDIDDVNADDLDPEHEATPFAPTHKRLTKHGGLGYHAQDPNCVLGQWAPHELFPVRPSMLTTGTDYRQVLQPGEAGYEDFIMGLGKNLGPEINMAQTGEYGKQEIAQNAGNRFPIMQKYILDKFPHLGKYSFTESDLASQDASGDAGYDRRAARRAWDRITVDDIVRNVISRRERELQIRNPKDPLDVLSAGSLPDLLDQHFPDEIAEGSLGYLPAYPSDMQYTTTVPPWVAANIALQKYIMPVKRAVPTEEEMRGSSLGENMQRRQGQMSDLYRYKEYNVPPPRMDPSLAVRPEGENDGNYVYSSGFHPYWQGAALNAAAMLYMGRHPNMRNSTLYPLQAAKALIAQKHGQKKGNLSDGDGSGTSKSTDFSFHHRQLGKAGQPQHEAVLKDFEAKHAASLWGLGGTPPISYSDDEGEHSGKTIIAGHLDAPFTGIGIASPYLNMIRQMHRSRKDGLVDSHYLDHPNIYMPDDGTGRGTNHDLYAMLMSKPAGRRFGKRYDKETGMYVDDQPLPLRPHWKDMLESMDVPEFGPHFYKVVQHNGRDALKLQRIGGADVERGIFAPLDYLYRDTVPLEGGWQSDRLQGKTTFDPSMLTVGRRIDDALFPAMSAAEDRQGNRQVHDMLTNEYVYLPDSGAILTQKDEDGNDMVLGPHPALLASQWADFAMAESPSPAMREAMDNLNSAAKESIQHIPLPQEDRPDIMYRAGVSASGHHLGVRNHINVAHALRSAWPIAKAFTALATIPRDEYFQFIRDRPLKEKLDIYEQEYLSIPEGATAKEAAPKRARIYNILRLAHDFIAGHDEALNKHMAIRLFREISNENDPELMNQWQQVFRDAGLSTKDGEIQFDYRTHSPLARYTTKTFTGADPHPLSSFAEDEMRDQVRGSEILFRYLDESAVKDRLEERGFEPSDVSEAITALEAKFPLGEEDSNLNRNRHHISQARQHELGRHSSQWFRNIGKRVSRVDPELGRVEGVSAGKRQKPVTRYRMLLMDRGRHARRARDASRWVDELSDVDFNQLMTGLGPLLWDSEDSLSPLGIIQNDLQTKLDKNQRPAFSAHHNVLSKKYEDADGNRRRFYEEDDDMRTKMKRLVEFIFAKGHYSDVHNYGETVMDGIEKPVIGGHHSEPSTVPSTMNFSKAKLSSFLFNPLTLRQFGLEIPEGMEDTAFVRDERIPQTIVDEGGETRETTVGRSFDTFPAGSVPQTRYLEFHPDTLNGMLGYQLDNSDGNNFEQPPAAQDIAMGGDQLRTSMDSLTNTDLLLKADKGDPIPVKAMHRIFTLDDLEYFKGFSGDWVVSSWPIGERLMVTRKSNVVKAKDSHNEDFTLSNEVKKDVRAAHDSNFMVDCIWDGDTLHIMDIVRAGDEDMENEHTKHRIRHLRANFSATENVSIPAPVNTKRVDNEGLKRAVKDLFKEKGVKQVMLRDADSTYMKGETRHPKWLLMTKEKQVDVIVLESEGAATLLGVGPLVDEDAKKMGNRAVKYNGHYYMDVGTISKSGLQQGKFITVKTSNVVCKSRNGLMIFTLHGAKYVRDSESQAGDSLKTLELLSGENSENVPHKLRVSKGSVHLEFPVGHVVYDTEAHGHSFIVKSVDAPSPYMATLAESQREYWEPLAAVFLRAEIESKKAKKANVVPEPPANHDKKPKKVLKPSERLLKDPKLLKQLMTVLEAAEDLLKEKVTFTGPKGLGIDFATPVESPSGPTDNTEPYNLPDHDPAHRQEKGGDCWCGAKKGQMCEQGTGVKIDVCPRFSPPEEEKKKKHIKIDVS